MKEVVDEILAAEKKVDGLLTEARQQAAELRQESEKKASDMVSAAHEQAQELMRNTVAAARTEAENTRDTTFSRFREQQQDLLDRNRAVIDTLVDEIVALITSEQPG